MNKEEMKERIDKIRELQQSAYDKNYFNGGIAIAYEGEVQLEEV